MDKHPVDNLKRKGHVVEKKTASHGQHAYTYTHTHHATYLHTRILTIYLYIYIHFNRHAHGLVKLMSNVDFSDKL
jgi:hypothetical protein